ncbi:hypothetical protein ES707_22588 [subsurface metagenome]
MQKLIEKGNLLRKIGFYRTLNILPSDGTELKLNEFYAKLLKSDYYNLFLRIRSELLKKKIIEIDYDQKKARRIKLTGNGVILKFRLKELIQQIEKGSEK